MRCGALRGQTILEYSRRQPVRSELIQIKTACLSCVGSRKSFTPSTPAWPVCHTVQYLPFDCATASFHSGAGMAAFQFWMTRHFDHLSTTGSGAASFFEMPSMESPDCPSLGTCVGGGSCSSLRTAPPDLPPAARHQTGRPFPAALLRPRSGAACAAVRRGSVPACRWSGVVNRPHAK